MGMKRHLGLGFRCLGFGFRVLGLRRCVGREEVGCSVNKVQQLSVTGGDGMDEGCRQRNTMVTRGRRSSGRKER